MHQTIRYFSSIKILILTLLILYLLIPNTSAALIPIEQTISARSSVRAWNSIPVPSATLLEVFQNAYGYSGNQMSVPQVGIAYSLELFLTNTTGTFRYLPAQNILVVHEISVNKETIRSRFEQSNLADANSVIIIVWNKTRMVNQYYASLEAGLVTQNIYLSAVSLSLGTVCVGLINSEGLRNDLKLQNNMIPLLVMPLGYPTSQYPTANPDYSRMTGNLPVVQNSQISYAGALANLLYAQGWSSQVLTSKEISQILWASYGYTSIGHRTVPSAYNVYPFKIWFINATATYEYAPQTHSVIQKLQGDKRAEISNVFASQSWAANAPTIFLIVYDSSISGGDGGIVSHEFINVDAGATAQNIILEAAAWDLNANIVSRGLEDWNGAGAASIRNILGMSSPLIPICAVPVGHGGAIPEFRSFIILFITITAFVIVLKLVLSHHKHSLPLRHIRSIYLLRFS